MTEKKILKDTYFKCFANYINSEKEIKTKGSLPWKNIKNFQSSKKSTSLCDLQLVNFITLS